LSRLRFVELPIKSKEGLRTQLQEGDVLISITADIGISGYISSTVPKPAYINQHIALVRFDRGKTDSKYISYYLASETPQKLFIALTDSGAKAGMNLSTVQKICLSLPSTKIEQTAIANALSDADTWVQSLTRLIGKKRQIKQGAMQTLLNPYGNGRLKAGWVVKKLGDVVDKFIGGGTPSRTIKKYWGNDIPWVTVKDFATFNPYTAQESITFDGLKNSATHLIPKRTIITSTRMALGKAVVYDVDVCINQDLKAVFPTKEIVTQYMLYWFEYSEEKIADLGSGSTVMGLSLDDLKKIDFPKPTLNEQTHIATILSNIDNEITALETKLTKAQTIKQGMMQNLLTGRIRLI